MSSVWLTTIYFLPEYDKERLAGKEKFQSKWVVNKKPGHQESRLQFRPLIDDLHVQRHKGLITRKGTNTSRTKKKIIANQYFYEWFSEWYTYWWLLHTGRSILFFSPILFPSFVRTIKRTTKRTNFLEFGLRGFFSTTLLLFFF